MSQLSDKLAVDSSVLLDVILENQPQEEQSRSVLNQIARRGQLLLSPVALSELSVHFKNRDKIKSFIESKPFKVTSNDKDVSWWASRFFRRYIKHRNTQENRLRKKIMPDFFIASHAFVHADHLLTRDEDFRKGYFQEISVLSPEEILA